MKSALIDVPAAIRVSRATLRNIHENLFWAFIYNSIGIPLAAGCFVALGLTLSPMFGAAAMSLSSFCVVTNALRLNLCKLYNPAHDKKVKAPASKSADGNEITVHIKGMMCEHCENRVKAALEALPNVESADVSHKSGTAILTLKGDIKDGDIKKAVEDAGYKVKQIEKNSPHSASALNGSAVLVFVLQKIYVLRLTTAQKRDKIKYTLDFTKNRRT